MQIEFSTEQLEVMLAKSKQRDAENARVEQLRVEEQNKREAKLADKKAKAAAKAEKIKADALELQH